MSDSLLSRFISGTFFISLAKFVTVFLGFASMVIYARWIPEAEYGSFVLLQVIVGFAVSLSNLGTTTAAIKFIAGSEDEQERYKLISSFLLFVAVMLIISSVLILVFRNLIFKALGSALDSRFLIYLPLLLFIEGLLAGYGSVASGLFKFKLVGGIELASSVSSIAITIVLVVWLGQGIMGVVWARVISRVLALLLGVWGLGLRPTLAISYQKLKALLRFSFPLFLNRILNFLFSRADTVIIGILLGPADIAFYEYARKIPESVNMMFESLLDVYYPYQSRLYSNGEYRRVSSLLNHTNRLVTFLGAFGALVSFGFGTVIYRALFSERYLPSVPIFWVMMVGLIFTMLDSMLGYSLVGSGASDKPPVINVLRTAISFAAYFLLIPKVGAIGAALAGLISTMAVNPVNVFFLYRRYINVNVLDYVKPLLILGACVGIMRLLDVYGYPLYIAVIVLYFFVSYIFSVFTRSDVEIARNEIRNLWRRARTYLQRVFHFSYPAQNQQPSVSSGSHAQSSARPRMNVLFITPYFPYPPTAGNPIRNYNLLKRIGNLHYVWLLTFDSADILPHHIEHLKSWCQDIILAKPPSVSGALDRPWDLVTYMASGTPPDLRFYYSEDMADTIRGLCQRVDFDVVQVEDSYMGLYLNQVPPGLRARSVLTFHDVVFEKQARMAGIERRLPRKIRLWFDSWTMRRWEPFFAERFGYCVTVSARDREILLSLNPDLRVKVIPNGTDTNLLQPLPEPSSPPSIIFVGSMGYFPNADAAIHLCRDILPLLQQKVSDLQTWIVGNRPGAELLKWQSEQIHITGLVEDVVPYYKDAHVCVIPLRAGGGTRLKILEAMALGRPVVSTSIGCEGLDVVDGHHLLIADDPQAFADAVFRLLRDDVLRKQIVTNALELVRKVYDWNTIADQLMSLYSELAISSKRRNP